VVAVPKGPRWETLERIYHQAVERPLAERNAFLESACAGDDALRRELESLLANEGPSFLEKSALGVAAWDMHLTASWIGRRIGGYEVLALLGAGCVLPNGRRLG
jgi:eukaryotic-like serine/threonine-protein kinase